MMEHPAELLLNAENPMAQRALFGLVFEETPTYEEILNGTPKLTWIFKLSILYLGEKSQLVAHPGIKLSAADLFYHLSYGEHDEGDDAEDDAGGLEGVQIFLEDHDADEEEADDREDIPEERGYDQPFLKEGGDIEESRKEVAEEREREPERVAVNGPRLCAVISKNDAAGTQGDENIHRQAGKDLSEKFHGKFLIILWVSLSRFNLDKLSERIPRQARDDGADKIPRLRSG